MTSRQVRGQSTDPGLLGRLKHWDDDKTWTEFYRIYRRLIYGFARRQGLGVQEAEDVVQETLLSVAKALHTFKYDAARCSFRHWLCRLTRNRAIDQIRRRPREVNLARLVDRVGDRTGTAEVLEDPRVADSSEPWQGEWESRVLQAALRRLKRQVKSRHYQVFDLLVLQQQPPSRVAAALGLNMAQVYLTKHRVMRKFNHMIKGIRAEC